MDILGHRPYHASPRRCVAHISVHHLVRARLLVYVTGVAQASMNLLCDNDHLLNVVSACSASLAPLLHHETVTALHADGTLVNADTDAARPKDYIHLRRFHTERIYGRGLCAVRHCGDGCRDVGEHFHGGIGLLVAEGTGLLVGTAPGAAVLLRSGSSYPGIFDVSDPVGFLSAVARFVEVRYIFDVVGIADAV